jgi:ankyrin repeat protein
MSDRELPARPNLDQYKKQAKDLARDCALSIPEALTRITRHHPRLHHLQPANLQPTHVSLTDAQLVIAREHGFESWPKFAAHIETLHLIRSVASLADPVSTFIEVACVPRHTGHGSGTLEHADLILTRYPQVATASIHTAAILADEPTVRTLLSRDPSAATAKGGPHQWDALTHLCFSRYLRLDKARSAAFVLTAQTLLDAGSSANTGWYEMIDHPNPRPTFESAIYGAAGIAHHPELTRLLLQRGADPNDEETPYHVPEGYDNAVTTILLESGTLNATSLTTMLLRKTDWHDEQGLRLLLQHNADPNLITKFGDNALHHALRRDNALSIIELLLDHAADPSTKNTRDNQSAISQAARRGRADVLHLFAQRNIPQNLDQLDQLIAACAQADHTTIHTLLANHPHLQQQLLIQGGDLLTAFAGNGNAEGLRTLLDLGIPPTALSTQDNPYFEIAKDSTALHIAAWRARPSAVKLLIERGSPINITDSKGRTPLALAIKACVDSYWQSTRTPESIEALLRAGASTTGIEIPTGYDEADTLLRQPR